MRSLAVIFLLAFSCCKGTQYQGYWVILNFLKVIPSKDFLGNSVQQSSILSSSYSPLSIHGAGDDANPRLHWFLLFIGTISEVKTLLFWRLSSSIEVPLALRRLLDLVLTGLAAAAEENSGVSRVWPGLCGPLQLPGDGGGQVTSDQAPVSPLSSLTLPGGPWPWGSQRRRCSGLGPILWEIINKYEYYLSFV